VSRRIVTPIDPVAFNAAQVAYLLHYPNPQPQPGSRAHRQRRDAWLNLYAQNGGVVDQGGTFQAKDPGNVVEPCPLKNVIASVAFLSGSTEVNANAVQRVNLPRERKFVDGVRVTHRDRLGHELRVKVRFQRKKKEDFKVALLAHNANPTYTGPERGHSTAYGRAALTPADPAHVQGAFDHYVGAVYTGRTGSDGKAVIEGHFEIPPSGGAKYKLVAWDVNGNVVFSGAELETKRSLFYATFLANDPNGVRVDQNWFRTQLEGAYTNQAVELVHVGEENLPNIVYHDIMFVGIVGDVVQRVAAQRTSSLGCKYSELAPYLTSIAFVDHAAECRYGDFQPVRFDNASPGDVVQAPLYRQTAEQRQVDPTAEYRKCLWVGLGPTLDVTARTPGGHDWFGAAQLTSHGDGGDVTVQLTANDLTLIERNGFPGAMVEVSFAIPQTFPQNRAATFVLSASFLYSSKLGQSLTGKYAGITIQPARWMFEPVPNQEQLSAAIHEVAHAMGMVMRPTTQGIAHPKQYHFNGGHCWQGMNGPAQSDPDYHLPPLKDTGTCVMYGLIPPGAPSIVFCADCTAALQKADLSRGFTGYLG
jgi:hypothetical protein